MLEENGTPIPMGKAIMLIRKSKHISLAELARTVNISKGYLHSIESGETEAPSVYIVARIAHWLGVTVEDLIEGHVDPVLECPLCHGKGWLKPRHLEGVTIIRESEGK